MITKGTTDTTPKQVGVDPDSLANLDRFLLDQIEANNIQAAGYVLSRHGKVFAHGTMGTLSGFEEEKDGFLPDSLHSLASATKVFTATAIMQLVERGKLSLEQPLSTFMPEFANPMHEKITSFHLMTHTSGLRADPGAHLEPYPRSFWSDEITEANWISIMLRGPVQYPVGEVYNYCTAGFMLLGEVVARISGISYTEYMHKYIFEPLGMTRTFFDVPDEYRESVCLVTEMDAESLNFPRERPFVGSWAAGGGIYSTLIDVWKLGQMMLNKGTFNGQRILGRKSVEAMTRNHLHSVPTYNWGIPIKAKPFGLGWEIDKDPTFSAGTISHEGFGWTSLFIDPQEELVYVCMTPTKNDWWIAKPMIPRTIVLSALI